MWLSGLSFTCRMYLPESSSRPDGSSSSAPRKKARPRPNSTAARRLDCSDVDLLHLHHGVEHALSGSGVGTGDGLRQHDRRNLPGQSPFVLAPAAHTLLAAIADNRVPVAIRFG